MQLRFLPFVAQFVMSDVMKMRSKRQVKDEKIDHLAFLSPFEQIQSFPWPER